MFNCFLLASDNFSFPKFSALNFLNNTLLIWEKPELSSSKFSIKVVWGRDNSIPIKNDYL